MSEPSAAPAPGGLAFLVHREGVTLRDLAAEEAVTEYGVAMGLARCPIPAGSLVHTHNVRSARWRGSV